MFNSLPAHLVAHVDLDPWCEADGAFMEAALGTIEGRYGSLDDYLDSIGLTEGSRQVHRPPSYLQARRYTAHTETVHCAHAALGPCIGSVPRIRAPDPLLMLAPCSHPTAGDPQRADYACIRVAELMAAPRQSTAVFSAGLLVLRRRGWLRQRAAVLRR